MEIDVHELAPDERAKIAIADLTAEGRALFDALEAELSRVREYRRQKPQESADWKSDIRWMLSREETLEEIIGLPKRARDEQNREGSTR
jgi:ATP-dependent protease HslVU (ClpYQ) peptidase subunit